MNTAQRLAVERVLHERHLANIDALDSDPRHPAYQWGTRAALTERARAYNALAAYHHNPNPRNRAALILALAWGLDGKFTTGAQARAASWLDDLEEPQA